MGRWGVGSGWYEVLGWTLKGMEVVHLLSVILRNSYEVQCRNEM
jgi:hypothetical protein